MNDDIESMLVDKDEILPSSGFEMLVMEAVHREAVTPPPLAFPWGRALPGMVALFAAFGVVLWIWISAQSDTTPNASFDEPLRELLAISVRSEIEWVAVAIAATIVSVLLSLRLMRGRV
jgi:hypothetical protein